MRDEKKETEENFRGQWKGRNSNGETVTIEINRNSTMDNVRIIINEQPIEFSDNFHWFDDLLIPMSNGNSQFVIVSANTTQLKMARNKGTGILTDFIWTASLERKA